MKVEKIIQMARKYRDHGDMSSSARSCLADAINLFDKGEFEAAKKRALKSLQYSIGGFHRDYIRASK